MGKHEDFEVAHVCSRCRHALTFSPEDRSTGAYLHFCDYLHQDLYPRMPGLVQSIASTGCQLCSFLLSAIRSRDGNAVEIGQGADGTGDIFPLQFPRRVYLALRFSLLNTPTKNKSHPYIIPALALELVLHVNPAPGSPVYVPPESLADSSLSYVAWKKFPSMGCFTWPVTSVQGPIAPWFSVAKPISRHALEDGGIEFILSNLRTCSETCQHSRSTEPAFLPTRLLDVRGAKMRVIETTAFGPAACSRAGNDTRYLTLSYCWGNAEQAKTQLRLSIDSQSRLRRGFLLEEMSPVQQDAVATARALGVPYLWIDALCIRQGDRDDWARESSQMHRIYSGSYATLCALTSASCQEGFLARGSNPFTVRLPFNYPEDVPGEVSTFEIGNRAIYSGDSSSLSEMAISARDSSRWVSRGWTFQEEILSTRTIYFTRLGLIFACSEYTRTECDHRTGESDVGAWFKGSTILNLDNQADVYDMWCEQVIKYSQRELTSVTDVFPALSGLAQQFAAATGDEYVAGLWSKDLPRQLSWTLRRPRHTSLSSLTRVLEQPSVYVAPSWSWAGRGLVGCFSAGRRTLDLRFTWGKHAIKIRHEYGELKKVIVPEGPDRFGQISSGELSLVAYVLPLGSAPFSYIARENMSSVGEYQFHRHDGISMMFTCYLDWELASDDEEWTQDLLLMLTGSVEAEVAGQSQGRSFAETDPCGLIIQPTGAEDKYLRVGTFDRAPQSHLKPFLEQDPAKHHRLSVEFLKTCEKRNITLI